MVEKLLTSALEYYIKSKRSFGDGLFDKAKKYILQFEALDYAFVKKSLGRSFEWGRHIICIVTYKQQLETEQLLRGLSTLLEDPAYCVVLVSNAHESLFPYADELTDGRFLQLITGGNFGASIGRNIAIHFAEGETITFIDDDGVTTADCVRKLIETQHVFDATAVRGRVVPSRNFKDVPKHYDLGQNIKQRFADIEGMTTWKLAALKRHKFEPLLYGHEGIELTARLYPVYGPDAFLYEPEAVLRHDFVKPDASVADKIDRMKRNEEFISQTNPDLPSIRSVFYNLAAVTYGAKLLAVRRNLVAAKPSFDSGKKLTFVTTCFNGALHLAEYSASIKQQTNSNFEVVFVDDGSSDDSVDIVAKEFASDARFKLIQSDRVGRSAALNLALENTKTELVVIADVDDISVPQRAEWTLRAYEQFPTADLIGFSIFDKKSAVRSARPLVSKATAISVRQYFGMPCPFPGLSFRRESFSLPFDTRLEAGVDCDWLYRNIEGNNLAGWYLPVGVTYYRIHDGQITAAKRDLQKRVSLGCVRKVHEVLLGSLTPEDEDGLELFTGWKAVTTGADWHRLKEYGDRLVHGLERVAVVDRESIQEEIIRHIDERLLNLAKSDQAKFKTRLEKAEQTVRALASVEGKLTRTVSKLEWNRNRVRELETTLKEIELSKRSWFSRRRQA
jgi:glycosyltransferase involved in cell wall biosynthesis